MSESDAAYQQGYDRGFALGLKAAGSQELDKRFTYHPPEGEQVEKYEFIRKQARQFAQTLSTLCPGSREKALALTKLEEAVMWANAAIARRE